MANELKIASVLAFERKLDPSDALLFAGAWEARDKSADWAPVKVREKSVRGTQSSRKDASDVLKKNGKVESPNPQTVDAANLPPSADTLKVQFTLRVLPGTGAPSACNNADYKAKLEQTVAAYVQANGFGELARRYAHNLANGRFLWRNRIGAEQVQVKIEQIEKGKPAQAWTFDALQLSLRNFDSGAASAQLKQLAALIASGLDGTAHVLLRITAHVRIGAGQEVFPSQELILERGRGDKSKTLYDVDGVAAIHSQKLGNAIRTIDDWYEGAAENGPIAVEPYGSVTTQGKAWRPPKQKDFYILFDNWVLGKATPQLEEQHFVMAVLVRGGVFGDADK